MTTSPLPFYVEHLQKPDGRGLTLYGLQPVHLDSEVPSPSPDPVDARPVMRWHPLRGEWVMYAAHRLGRTFLPPPEYNPLAPTSDPAHPTELPRGTYDIAVFDNRFPSLTLEAPSPPTPAHSLNTEQRAATGKCEVVVFSQNASGRLADLSDDQMALLLGVWADRTSVLAATGKIRSVLAFENRGVEVGVTLHHPHGQIYAYDHVPPVQATILAQAQKHRAESGEPWLETFVKAERDSAVRVIRDEGLSLSVVPPFARYTYETWVVPARPVGLLSDLDDAERMAFARVLKDALQRLDGLFGARMPYLMTVHQAPVGDAAVPDFPLHIEIYPYLRAPGRLKFLAGTEQGAGEFANDKFPEVAAQELREVQVENL
ncbi:galactose-1-phosphate uridylyltransferase [Deinococcus deserti]|uniref:Galactose-1-phosphate uridylyltransferase n=1 Tax=Deinococcus deserti (strain DSM 17065 / CIP 109153 / LMG 22923 / VCD115) TaxID=546414 RepID=C1D3A6_DEIDV|nr:galactose-1-phosphate uridylyltransferase [Deinococcus deserti]ACO47895.1 putative UDP-glucose--hexose-1-phosphate uridylyltransferase [Deinococcus deserti VCD115]